MSKQSNRKTRAHQQRNAQTKKLVPPAIGAIVVLFVVFVAFTMVNQATPVNGIGVPRLQVDREKIDLGNRIFNQSVRAMFNVKNVGDGTLKLDAPRVATVLEGC